MNFGDRYCVKTRWIFKPWWKPGDFFVVNTKKCFTGSKFTKRSVLSLLFGENYVFSWWKWIENLIGPKPGENLVNFQNLVKKNLMNFQNQVKTWWKPSENLVKTCWKLDENLVKTWWKLGECSKLGENLVSFQNLVKTWWIFKTWWKPGEFSKLGENLVNFQTLVKTWWKPGECSKLGENLVNFQNLVKTWWIFKPWWKPGDFFVVNTKKCFTGSKFTKRSVLSLLFGENYVS